MNVSISICPTSLEFDNGDRYDEEALLAAIRRHIERRHPGATISCLQIGHRQGDAWARIDGDDEAGGDLLVEFFDVHGTEAGLYASRTPGGVSARLEERPSEGTGWYVYVDGQDAGGPFETEADALSAWQARS